MWDIAFDESMLRKGEVIILCPEKDLVDELFALLRAHDICWANGLSLDSFTNWGGDDTCYRVSLNGKLTYGSLHCYADSSYDFCTRCQFVGTDNEISDSDFESILMN